MYRELFSYKIRMTSESHPGNGLAIPGLVDALVSRTADGWFCLEEGTLKGMVRDGAERLLVNLGGRRDDPRIITLFGKPGREKDDQGICSLPSAILRKHPDLLPTSVRYGNLVNRTRGCVEEDFFFSREVLPTDQVFEGKIFIRRELSVEEKQLLILSLKMVETFGGKRTRGDGWALIELDPYPEETQILGWLETIKSFIPEVPEGYSQGGPQ